jgi:hypothetical protein
MLEAVWSELARRARLEFYVKDDGSAVFWRKRAAGVYVIASYDWDDCFFNFRTPTKVPFASSSVICDLANPGTDVKWAVRKLVRPLRSFLRDALRRSSTKNDLLQFEKEMREMKREAEVMKREAEDSLRKFLSELRG